MRCRCADDNVRCLSNRFALAAQMTDPRFAEQMAIFVDVVRGGSFSSAARRRAVTPSAIMRQIGAMEESLGVPLLIRSTRALALTDAGQRLFERAQHLLDALADTRAEIAAFDGAIAGVVRIACFPTFGRRYVIPALGSLMAEHSAITAEIDLTEKLADPVADRFDAVIRIGELSDSSLIATKLADQKRLLVASPSYLDSKGTPADVASLSKHALIDKLHGADLLGWSDVLGRPAGSDALDRVAFRSDDFEAMRLATLVGMGIGLLADWVVGPDVRSGALIRLGLGGESWNRRPTGIYLLRALAKPSAKLGAFMTALREQIGTPPTWEQ